MELRNIFCIIVAGLIASLVVTAINPPDPHSEVTVEQID